MQLHLWQPKRVKSCPDPTYSLLIVFVKRLQRGQGCPSNLGVEPPCADPGRPFSKILDPPLSLVLESEYVAKHNCTQVLFLLLFKKNVIH